MEYGALGFDKLAVEKLDGRVYAQFASRFEAQARARNLIVVFDGFFDFDVVARSVLLHHADALNLSSEIDGTSVEDGKLGAVHLNQAVVDAESHECCHAVLDGRNAHFWSADHRAA